MIDSWISEDTAEENEGFTDSSLDQIIKHMEI